MAGVCRYIQDHGLLFTWHLIMLECGMWGLNFGLGNIWDSSFTCEFIHLWIHPGMNILFQRMPCSVVEPKGKAQHLSETFAPQTVVNYLTPLQKYKITKALSSLILFFFFRICIWFVTIEFVNKCITLSILLLCKRLYHKVQSCKPYSIWRHSFWRKSVIKCWDYLLSAWSSYNFIFLWRKSSFISWVFSPILIFISLQHSQETIKNMIREKQPFTSMKYDSLFLSHLRKSQLEHRRECKNCKKTSS